MICCPMEQIIDRSDDTRQSTCLSDNDIFTSFSLDAIMEMKVVAGHCYRFGDYTYHPTLA